MNTRHTTNFITTFLLLYIESSSFAQPKREYSHIDDAQKKFALSKGDLMIGALFSVHEAPASEQKNQMTCGKIRDQYGIQRVEAALQTIDEINESKTILPNITLGIEIRDTCWSPLIALHQSLQFVEKLFVPKDWYSCNLNSFKKQCQNDTPPILGVIGPASSEETIQVQNLLQLFHIPEVGYSTTSSTLSDREKFQYFVRVVPSDIHQARVMVEILRKYQWNFVFAVHSEGEYGRSGMKEFKKIAADSGVCIASEHTISDHAKPEELDDIVRKFEKNGRAKVVVCFCEGRDIGRLLSATKRMKKENYFVFLGSDSWAGRDDVVRGLDEAAQGNLMINVHSPRVANFDKYYYNISKRNDSRNPWLEEFYNSRFNCSTKKAPLMARCKGNESAAMNYVQDPKLSFIIKSIYALAHALNSYRNDICGKYALPCPNLYPINGTLFMEYLRNVTFKYHEEIVKFNNNNNSESEARYDIWNYQQTSNGSYNYIQVGHWMKNKLEIYNDIQFPDKVQNIQSVCSDPCSPGQQKLLPENGEQNRTCCWTCTPCRSREISDGEICQRCAEGFKPNHRKDKCEPMSQEYVRYSSVTGIVCVAFSVIGICLTVGTILQFYKFGDTPVVKSSTKELCYMMFVGMILAHSCTFILVGKPTNLTCTIARIVPGMSLCIMFSALLVKTNRMARILSISKKRFPKLRPRFMSTTSQVYICCILILVELLVCVIPVYLDLRADKPQLEVRIDKVSHGIERATLVCSSSYVGQNLIFQFIFDVVLLSLCTLYAFKTRNLPNNFNEAKYIGFACYATAITWLAFISVYLGSSLQILSQCISLSTSALINLIFLFFPKLYIILCVPEKNTRSYFITTKNLRCHFGSTYLIQNYEQLMSKILKNGFISKDTKFTDIEQLNQKVKEYYTSHLNENQTLNNDITTKSCQTSLEKIYFKIPDLPASNNNEDVLATSDQETS